jgi:hypothetical protein
MMGMKFQQISFASEGQLEDYVQTVDYDTATSPGICAAIVINDLSNGYEIKLRYDDNSYSTIGQSSKQEVPTTRNPTVNLLSRYLTFLHSII